MREDAVSALIDQFVPRQAAPADWDLPALTEAMMRDFNTPIDPKSWIEAEPELDEATFRARCGAAVLAQYEAKRARIGAPLMRQVERDILLRTLDQHWREHLAAMDYLRQGIHLRGYAQKNPKQEYKREAFELFSQLLDVVKLEVTRTLMTVRIQSQD